ncbi:LCP family protein [Microtetraspora glauca]|uniref:LCP family protein n=1 Tax=Microtetraspora glauca TaxID=1996 RepID=A0ABV3GPP3_MICGL
MDDLKLLRDLGRELEHEPPATLARQRGRLLGSSAHARAHTQGPDQAHVRASGRVNRRTRTWAMLALAAGLTAAVVTVPTVLLNRSSIVGSDVGVRTGTGGSAPTGPLNLLLIGSDTRAGSNGKYGRRMGDQPGRSDTLILVHLPADRKSAEVVSIPRDSMVVIPDCRASDGKVIASHVSMINSAYAEGGLICARRTVESLTKVRIHHTISIDFSGFKQVIDAVGGVEITVPKAVDDPKAKLRLPAGRQILDGEQALGYARARYALGDGSDLMRIKRQHTLMRAVLKKAKDLPSDPARLATFVKAASTWITTDSGFDMRTMYDLARGLAGVKPSATTFTAVPVVPYPPDRNRLSWKQPAADKLFERFRSAGE